MTNKKYQIAVSHTLSGLGRRIVFQTNQMWIMRLAWFVIKRAYKNKMFVWSKGTAERMP
jgi:hypothetical protein